MQMKQLLENFDRYLNEATPCEKQKPVEAGKRFEWVVVYKARELANAKPLSDPEYACCPQWSNQSYKSSTLGVLAERSIQLALDSGAITMSDLAAANMQRMGKQPSQWGGGKIEIKTDILFGKKTISVKLDGDVQGQTAEAKSTLDQMVAVFDEVLDGWDQVERKAEIETTRLAIAKLTKEMTRLGQKARITQSRVRKLVDEELTDPKKKEKALKRYNLLLNAEIINETGEIINKELDQGLWNLNHSKRLKVQIDHLLDSDPELRRQVTDEILTGRRMFANAEGAAAEYILSPDHFYVLAPGVEGYEDSLNIFSRAMDLGVRGKSGRTVIRGVSIGNKPAYRFDIKAKALAAAHKFFEEKTTQN